MPGTFFFIHPRFRDVDYFANTLIIALSRNRRRWRSLTIEISSCDINKLRRWKNNSRYPVFYYLIDFYRVKPLKKRFIHLATLQCKII